MAKLVTGQSMMPPGFAVVRCGGRGGWASEVKMRAETMVAVLVVVSSILEVASVFEKKFWFKLRAWR